MTPSAPSAQAAHPDHQSGALQDRYRSAAAAHPEYVRRPSQPVIGPAAVYQDHATKNLRRHVWRSARRVLTLLGLDLAAFLTLRWALHTVRALPGSAGKLVQNGIPEGFLGGWQFAAAMVLSLMLLRAYGPGDMRRSTRRVFLACALATALPLWQHLWSAPILVMSQYVLVVLGTTLVVSAFRIAIDRALWRFAPPPSAKVVLVGPGADCLEMMSRTKFARREAMQFVAFVDTATPEQTLSQKLHSLAVLLAEHEADTVMLCGHVPEEVFGGVVRAAATAEAHVLATSRSYEDSGVAPSVVWRNGRPFIELRAMTLRGQQLVLKRLLDAALATVGLLLLSPVIAVLALLVRLDSPGPIFFGQRRLGRHGRGFKCYKFRSMYADSEQRLKSDPELYALYVKNDYKLPPELDPRVTRMGAFLRKTSLDEIPQLWNVLKGEMSLVGPRPIVPAEIEHYKEQAPMLLLLKPGVTGSWQVSGRSQCNYPERTNVELDYVQNWSLGRDIGILFRTVPAVLLQRGAH